MIKTTSIAEIPEEIKDNVAKYLIFRENNDTAIDLYKNSLSKSLDMEYFVLSGYEIFIEQMTKEIAENEYVQICKLFNFYKFLKKKLETISEEDVTDIKNKIHEIIKKIRKIQITLRNFIERDLKASLSTHSGNALSIFLTQEYQKL